jgi:predicted ATPase
MPLDVVVYYQGSDPGRRALLVFLSGAYLTDAETAEKARSLVAKAVEGSDVDIVSNSEIVLNEVRIAVKKGRLSPEDVRIVWYKEGEPGHETRVEVGLTLSGRFASLPTGFFDTLDNQLARLI